MLKYVLKFSSVISLFDKKYYIIQVAMTKEEVKDYRGILEKEYMDKDTEIDSSISYISAGALGLVLSINDKFITIKTADFKLLLIASLILLLLALILIIYRKMKTSSHDVKMLDYLTEIKEGANAEQEEILLNLYSECDSQLKRIRVSAIISLLTGIGFEVTFFIINFFN